MINTFSTHNFYNNNVLYIVHNFPNGKRKLYLDLNVLAEQNNITIDQIIMASKCIPSINKAITEKSTENGKKFAIELQYIPSLLRLISLICCLFLDQDYLKEWDYEISLLIGVLNGE